MVEGLLDRSEARLDARTLPLGAAALILLLYPAGYLVPIGVGGPVVVGVLAGALARLLVPGPDPMSLGMTWLLGVVGSFVGGFLGYVIFGADMDDGIVQVSGVIGSVLGAIVVLLIYRSTNRHHTVS